MDKISFIGYAFQIEMKYTALKLGFTFEDDGLPAEMIAEIEGESTEGFTTSDAVRLLRGDASDVWFEAGIQAANGVTTLALTFTLLGISLGIGVFIRIVNRGADQQ